jgi:ABC-type bacteriocin/lantibiotic exporter with double-glycine peptidase domain
MDTVVSLNGGAFSGGQRQRLLIARALAARPRILLLDEATSALDNIAQRIITRNLAELGMTRIVVAHRLSTMVDADRILVVDRGRLVEEGTYKDLMARQGPFHALATRQLL